MKTKAGIVSVLCGLTFVGPAYGFESFRGSCASQGAWTQTALSQTKAIEAAVISLRDDPACKGIESIIGKVRESEMALALPSGQQALPASRMEAIPGELDALRAYLSGDGKLKSQVLQVLANKTLEGATIANEAASAASGANPAEIARKVKQLQERTSRAASMGIGLLDAMMSTLPQYEQCMNNHPNQALALFGAAVQMAGSFVSSGEGTSGRFGTTIANFVTFLRNKKYANIMRELNTSEYMMSMSCLVETTQQAYCSANEAYQLLDYHQKEEETRQKVASDKGGSSAGNPLEGYYLMVRELPTVSEWLQKVQYGVTPKAVVDANQKNGTLDTVNNLQKAANYLRGMYSEQLQQYQNLKDPVAKKNHVFNMIRNLVGSASNGSGDPTQPNFFTTTVMPEMLPFYFLGMDKMPAETAANSDGKFVMPWDQWMQNGGNFRPEFDDPDSLITALGNRLSQLTNSAMDKGSSFFRQRLIIDTPNLVNESVTSPSLSVVESLRNIRKYLQGMLDRAGDSDRGNVIVPSLIDTIQRIDVVLNSYEKVRKRVKQLTDAYKNIESGIACDLDDDLTGTRNIAQLADDVNKTVGTSSGAPTSAEERKRISEELRRKINQSYLQVIEAAYIEFNVLLQRDTFLSTRLNTFVRFDYSERVRKKENMSDYQRELMVVAGKNLLDNMIEVHALNPVETEMDLNSAQVVNTRNLEAIEELLADDMFKTIEKLNETAGGFITYVNPFSIRMSRTQNKSNKDDNRSFEQFRSKLCIQTLGFKDWKRFKPICEGSVMESRFKPTSKDVRLNLVYDEMVKDKAKETKRAGSTCALRNFTRENHVYWLTTQFNNNSN